MALQPANKKDRPRCHAHSDRLNWIGVEVRNRWRITCRLCGGLVGEITDQRWRHAPPATFFRGLSFAPGWFANGASRKCQSPLDGTGSKLLREAAVYVSECRQAELDRVNPVHLPVLLRAHRAGDESAAKVLRIGFRWLVYQVAFGRRTGGYDVECRFNDYRCSLCGTLFLGLARGVERLRKNSLMPDQVEQFLRSELARVTRHPYAEVAQNVLSESTDTKPRRIYGEVADNIRPDPSTNSKRKKLKTNIEKLVALRENGQHPDAELTKWVATIPEKWRKKLTLCGLLDGQSISLPHVERVLHELQPYPVLERGADAGCVRSWRDETLGRVLGVTVQIPIDPIDDADCLETHCRLRALRHKRGYVSAASECGPFDDDIFHDDGLFQRVKKLTKDGASQRDIASEVGISLHYTRKIQALLEGLFDGCGFKAWLDVRAGKVDGWLAEKRQPTKDSRGLSIQSSNH